MHYVLTLLSNEQFSFYKLILRKINKCNRKKKLARCLAFALILLVKYNLGSFLVDFFTWIHNIFWPRKSAFLITSNTHVHVQFSDLHGSDPSLRLTWWHNFSSDILDIAHSWNSWEVSTVQKAILLLLCLRNLDWSQHSTLSELWKWDVRVTDSQQICSIFVVLD